jgi:predicted ATP-binding protein involved in virulence
MSEQVPVYIKEVALVDFKGFRGEHKFSFVDENGEWCRWTVFLGNNNTGKTNLLKAIASLEPSPIKEVVNSENNKLTDQTVVYMPLGYKLNWCPLDSELGLDVLIRNNKDSRIHSIQIDGFYVHSGDFLKIIKNKIAYSYIGSTGFLPLNYLSKTDIYSNFTINSYGVIREIENKGIPTINNNILNSNNILNNTKLLNFEDWLFQLDYAAKNKQEKAAQRRDLLTTVLTSEIFPEIKAIQFISDEKLNNYIEFQTEDGWHKMTELGYGYQATLSWMVDFCKKLFDRYPESENPLKEPAVLLVDEIDLHLHPQWQRTIIKYLSDIFTATQFIVTTHSPFILQSMENVNLYTLQREGDHTIVSHLGNHSYIGWKIEEILSEVMGLEDNVNTDQYNALISMFDKALDADDYNQGKEAYEQLMKILHPQSAERKLLDIQFSQLTPDDDKA